MGRKIAIVGAGAVGGYAGAHMVQAGEDVTFIDPWPEHVEHMGKHGLRVTHAMDVAEFSVPVIFITAFPERLLTGERPEPTFLITKPFQPETVKAAISQALFFHPSRQKEAA